MPEAKENIEKELTPKQELFCKIYATDREFFGNGVQSYIEAYNPDKTTEFWYEACKASVSRLLTNDNILKRIEVLMEDCGFNDVAIDKQLAKLITQDADFSNKLGAIKEYNKLKQRIQDKLDLTTKGEKIVNIINYGDNAPVQVQPPSLSATSLESGGQRS